MVNGGTESEVFQVWQDAFSLFALHCKCNSGADTAVFCGMVLLTMVTIMTFPAVIAINARLVGMVTLTAISARVQQQVAASTEVCQGLQVISCMRTRVRHSLAVAYSCSVQY